MQIDPARVRKLIAESYIHQAVRAFGDKGASGIRTLLEVVHLVFQQFDAASVTSSLTIVIGVRPSTHSNVLDSIDGTQARSDLLSVVQYLVSNQGDRHLVVEICADETFRVASVSAPIDLSQLAISAIVYHFENRTDTILAGEYTSVIQKLHPSLASNFAAPTLDSLDDVLTHYSENWALDSRCRILKNVWVNGVDGPRLVLKNRPESIMRDSLCQAIDMMLRNANARPEHTTDETKPVDIVVNWFGTRSEAIIEVKWLGRSVANSRGKNDHPTYTDYSKARAQEGANQLNDYMDRETRHTGATQVWGYLAVFDARRKGVTDPDSRLPKNDAFHFQHDQIVYDPDHSATRQDFRPPYRIFLSPRESNCLP